MLATLPLRLDLGYNLKLGEVSEWLMVPLSKSGLAFSERGFESHPLRFFCTSCSKWYCSFFGEVLEWPIRRAWRARVVFGDRGFESHPLRFFYPLQLLR